MTRIPADTIKKSAGLPKSGDLIGLTISPPPADQHWNIRRSKKHITFTPYLERKKAFIEEWATIFDKWTDERAITRKFIMNLEISRGGLLHWHGTVELADPEIFYSFIGELKHIYGYQAIEANPITDQKEWDTYCTKDGNYVLTSDKRKPTIRDILQKK